MQIKVEHLIAAPFVSSLSFFNDKELHNLRGTSKTMHAAATEELRSRSLLKHIVLGEQDEAEALIQAHPKWLLNKAITADYSGRTIIATPFQAAIGAGDKPMWEMILRYLDPKEASRQFREWFPNGIEEDIPIQIDYNTLWVICSLARRYVGCVYLMEPYDARVSRTLLGAAEGEDPLVGSSLMPRLLGISV